LIDSEVVAAKEVRDADGERIEISTNVGDVVRIDFGGYADSEFAQLVPADAHGGLMVSEMYVW
jgi:hypothetical protein